ncbi:hypothetical protein NECID01_1955 [Nematocida sp. AWRm77]|nr:hypothetical protein NECID01_1955 [Nematocida sp. AWRm77]
MAKIVIVRNVFLLVWARAVLVRGAGSSHPDAERIYAGMPNLAAANTYYLNSSLLSTYDPRDNVYHESSILRNRLTSKPLDLSCKTGVRESSSCSGAAISTNLDTPTQACSSSDAKRIHKEVEKEDGEQRVRKKQKTKTKTTATGSDANTALMDETEVRMAVKKFSRFFGDDTNISAYMPRDMAEFANDLAQRGLASVHSREIVKQCMASEQWRGHIVFWRMLLFFVDTHSLEVVELNRLEDKKTIVLRDRTSKKPLSECVRQHISNTIAKFQGIERMEIQCSLGILERRSVTDVLNVLRWLLHHVNIQCVGISCDLTEAGMSSAALGRQVETLSKEWRGSTLRIDSLALYFNLAQYMTGAEIVKESPWVTVLKMHFIGAGLCQDDDINQALKALLLHFPALEQLCVFGLPIGIVHIQTIASMLPHLVLLEVGSLDLEKLALGQKEEEESMPVFPGLKTLKLSNIYNYSDAGMETFVELFSNLKFVQIPDRHTRSPLIDTLSKLPHLRSLETVNGSLSIETAEYLLEKLPSLECLSVGISNLDHVFAHVLSKYAGMRTLKLRGCYIPGFLDSLLQPSPLMNTLKVLTLYRNTGPSYRRGKFSAKDLSSKEASMEKFGRAVEIIYKI